MCNGRRETVAMRSPPLTNEEKKSVTREQKISPTKRKLQLKFKKQQHMKKYIKTNTKYKYTRSLITTTTATMKEKKKKSETSKEM